MRPLKFSTLTQAVIRAYANEVPTELAYDIFDTFPYPILMFLLIGLTVRTVLMLELRCD